MVILIHQLLLPPLSSSFSSSSSTKTRVRFCVSSSSSSSLTPMDHPHIGRGRFMEFPHLSASHRDLMVDLVSTMETRLASHLLPPSLPPDVQYYQNDTGSSQGSLHIRSGHHSSPIDFVLGNWLHCELPSGGGALDITTLSAYLNSSTDAPHFLIEFLQSSPTSLILLLDLPPRMDLVLHPDYLDTFYGDTQLDGWRQELEKVSEVRPYFSSSLYIRCIFSPAATLARIECEVEDGSGGPGRMEEIIREHVGPIAKQILGIWLDRCTSCGDREVGEAERALLEKRDRLIKNKTVEIDLLSSLPRLFGPDVANRVMGAIQEAFKT